MWLAMCPMQFFWFHFIPQSDGVRKHILHEVSDTMPAYLRQMKKEMKEGLVLLVTEFQSMLMWLLGGAESHGMVEGGLFTSQWPRNKGRKKEFGVPTIPSRPHLM